MPRRCRAPVDTTFGESEVDVSAPFVSPTPQLSPIKSIRTDVDKEAVLIYSINIRCLLSHLAELEFHLIKHRPHIVLIQETWLNESIESVAIRGYRTISRRDRKAGQNRGGVLTLARHDFNSIAHIRNSLSDERSWHFLNLGPETILLGNWYRSGYTFHDAFSELYADLNEFSSEITGIILEGDMNVHHTRWLRYSNGNTPIGADLKALCDSYGLTQLVKQPTRQESGYLLDLILTNVPDCTVKVLPSIADHDAIWNSVPLPKVTSKTIARKGWILQLARWSELKRSLKEFDWAELRKGSAEDALNYFYEILW